MEKNENTTARARKLRPFFYEKGRTDHNLAEALGMSITTFYKRLKTHKWKESEIYLIDHFTDYPPKK